jgi:hypothetical protein
MKNLFLLLSALFIFSCGTDDPEITITQCVDDEINVFASQACLGSGDLTKWNFDGEDVYCFNEGTCISDSQAFIYNGNCDLICVLGGIQGIQICDGLNWSSNASLIGVIYQY